jgi:hypothetical protein
MQMIDPLDITLPESNRRVRDITDRDELEQLMVSLHFELSTVQSEIDDAWVQREKYGVTADPQHLIEMKDDRRYLRSVIEAMRLHGKTLKKAGKSDHERRRQALFIECLRDVCTPEMWASAVFTFQIRFRAEAEMDK